MNDRHSGNAQHLLLTMNAFQTSSAAMYREVAVESSVFAADPHRLIDMLMDGALDSIALSIEAVKRGDKSAKHSHISRAALIIEEGLRRSLDEVAGGTIARDLDTLYRYLVARLTLANMRDDEIALSECASLLRPVHEAWQSIRPSVGSGCLQ